MGKKQPLAAVQKQRGGTDITRFFERKAGGKDAGFSPGRQHIAGIRPPGGRAPTPGKHLLDNVLLSQDLDDGGLQVVWASSPTAAFSPQKGTGVSQEPGNSTSQAPDNSQASRDGFRKTLALAVQRAASDAQRQELEATQQQQAHEEQPRDHQQQAEGQPGGELREQLYERLSSHGAASTSARGGSEAGGSRGTQQVEGRLSAGMTPARRLRGLAPSGAGAAGAGGTGASAFAVPAAFSAATAAAAMDEDAVMQEVLGAADTYKTPAAARTPGLARSGATASMGGSVLTLGGHKRPLVATSRKGVASGNKRRALLDLLDQVEMMVKQRAQPSQAVPPARRDSTGAAGSAPGSQMGPTPQSAGAEAGPVPGGAKDTPPAAAVTVANGGQRVAASVHPHGSAADELATGGLLYSPRSLGDAQEPVLEHSAAVPAAGDSGPASGSTPAAACLSLSMRPPAGWPTQAATLLTTNATQGVPAAEPHPAALAAASVAAAVAYTAADTAPAAAGGTRVFAPSSTSAGAGPGAFASARSITPEPVVLRPPTSKPASYGDDDDDDDALYGVIDIDALCAHHEPSWQPEPQPSKQAEPQRGPASAAGEADRPTSGRDGLSGPGAVSQVLAAAAGLLAQASPAVQPQPPSPLLLSREPAGPAGEEQAAPQAGPGKQGDWEDDDEDMEVDIDALVARASHPNSRATSPAPGAGPPASGPVAAAASSMPTQQAAQQLAQQPGRPPLPPHSQNGHRPPPNAQDWRQPVPSLPSVLPPAGQLATAAVPQPTAAQPASGGAGASAASAVPVAAVAIPHAVSTGGREDYHFVVLEAEPRYYGQPPHQFLRCMNESQGTELKVYLIDMWMGLEVRPGDAVNVIGGSKVDDPECAAVEISEKQGLLVLHPDVLLSGTSVIKDCPRQAWLSDRLASGPGGEPALLGSMMHELLQRNLHAALAGPLDAGRMHAEAGSIVRSFAPQLLEAGMTEVNAEGKLREQLGSITAWAAQYLTPNPAAPLGSPLSFEDKGTLCRVEEVLDIEENIWAPKFGLKGQLDASFRVTLSTKDPLHNQLTLTGNLASKLQLQQQLVQQQEGGARFHGMHRHHASDGGAPGSSAGAHAWDAAGAGGGMARTSARATSTQADPAVQGGLQRQHSWSAGMALPPGVQLQSSQQAAQAQATRRPPPMPLPPGVSGETVIAPFEFKSGQASPEHEMQVMLYLLLMEDRYRTAVRTGLLFNSKIPNMRAVKYDHARLTQVFMQRNRLATHLLGAASTPPPPLPRKHESSFRCGHCGVSATCALYLAAGTHAGAGAGGGGGGGGGGNGGQPASTAAATAASQQQLESLDVHEAVRERLRTVSPSCAAFFAHWTRLVDLEEQAARGARADLWALSGEQREQAGGCVSRLLFSREANPVEDSDGVRHIYVFGRQALASSSASAASGSGAAAEAVADQGGLLSSSFAPGDMGVLGVEGRHVAAARVTVIEVTKDTITLSSRKEIKVHKLQGEPSQQQQQQQQCTCGNGTSTNRDGDTLGSCGCGASAAVAGHCPPAPTWRLDREESASLFAAMRLNLAMLAVPGAGCGWQSGGGGRGGRGGGRGGRGGRGGGGDAAAAQATREANLAQLRRLVIDLEAPQQGTAYGGGAVGSQQLSGPAASSQLDSNPYLRAHGREMNDEQREAVQRVLAMRHYSLLLGMPGSGKTTTIVHIIKALVAAKLKVLVSSYTNSAVDNILLKLAAGGGCGGGGGGVNFVRLGAAASVHPGVRPYMPGGARHSDTSVAGLTHTMGSAFVVGCTCLSTHSPLLAGRHFDVCILDEASQVTLPSSLGALARARSFLLVGDHYQLSPLVQSREAAAGGLGVSLFRRLSEAHPQAVVTLRRQYRMAADIMALSNALVYNGRMLCGSPAVASATLRLPNLQALSSPAPTSTSVLAPSPAVIVLRPDSRASATSSARPAPSVAWPPSLLPAPAWLVAALDPGRRVVFLDTDGAAGCRDVLLQDGVVNPGEVRLVHGLAAALMAAGLAAEDIGVASPYKAQVAALQTALAAASLQPAATAAAAAASSGGGVEALTVDRYQGRDKPAILLSLVRSNATRSAGRLLADWQRLNVALTRARTKLLLVGSAATVGSIPMLADMLAALRARGAVEALPAECLAALPPLPAAGVAGEVGSGVAVGVGGGAGQAVL